MTIYLRSCPATACGLSLLQSYLSNRSQRCSVNSEISGFMPIICGVPQGSIFGPLLFIIYMNDYRIPQAPVTFPCMMMTHMYHQQ